MTRPGAIYTPGKGCTFSVWAPLHQAITLHIVHPAEQKLKMRKTGNGYFTTTVSNAIPGTRYYYTIDDRDMPDPASFSQPAGVHGPSEVIDLSYEWLDAAWLCPPLQDFIIYELHIGTFTPQGTFDAVIARLDDLTDTGINAIEIMPVAQFPGTRNWGYDGAFPYAAQNSYGGPKGFQKLVNACHNKGIAVILDVVYNHLGPEGNYLPSYAPYFTDKHHTPWGNAMNFDGPHSDEVRSYFVDNALFWMEHFHIDALRLDAIHEMYDFGAVHFWEQLNNAVEGLGRRHDRHYHLIAESDLNSPKIIKSPDSGGYGFSAQWLDDFHHALYVLLDKEGAHHYTDFGKTEQLAKAYTDGFVHSGDYVSFRQKTFGASSAGIPGNKFIVFNQNHDQVGNSPDGSRLSRRISAPLLKVAAAAMLLSPYIPMLFMGEEYGEDNPFTYFIDHEDEELIKAVCDGRKKEFAHEQWCDKLTNPKAEQTFKDCVLNWESRNKGKYKEILNWHRGLIELRKSHPACRNYNKNNLRVYVIADKCLALHRWDANNNNLWMFMNISDSEVQHDMPVFSQGWKKKLDLGGEDGTMRYADVIDKTVSIPPRSVGIYCNGS